MSEFEFFTSAESVFPLDCFLTDAQGYIISELDFSFDEKKIADCDVNTTVDKEEMIRMVVENADPRFRMYGTARELLENVESFANSPGTTWRHVDRGGYRLYPYHTTPAMYKSLKGEEYICKSDAYLILQNMTLAAFDIGKPAALHSLIAVFLRYQELENLAKMEFVRFDKKTFDEIYAEIKEQFEKFSATLSSRRYISILHQANGEVSKLCEKFRSLIPSEWKDSDVAYFQVILEEYVKISSVLPRFVGLTQGLYTTVQAIVNVLSNIIDSRVEIFKNDTSQVTVRVFEDGDRRFVLKVELMSAISRTTNKKVESHANSSAVFETIDMADVARNYGDQIQDIEFIRYPIRRAKHRAVPIAIGSRAFGILAADALLEFLRSLIFGFRIFQKPIIDFLPELRVFTIFGCEVKSVYFVKAIAGEMLVASAGAMLNAGQLPGWNQLPVKEVRNAKKDGFTVQNLKNELAHLNLTKKFPEIQNHADVVYSEVDKRKKESVLRTCDLFDAIEHCQLICIFNRLPNLKTFLHNQKSCRRVYGLECSTCPPFYQNNLPTKPQKTSESEKTLKVDSDANKTTSSKSNDQKASEAAKSSPESEQPTATSSESPKISESIISQQQKNPEAAKSSPTSHNQPTAFSEAPKTSEIKNPVQNVSKPAMESQKSSVSLNRKTSESQIAQQKKTTETPKHNQKASDSQKTSANCEKCFRACEMLNETKKELKSSENKLKNVEKKMLGKEREMEEFKKDQKGKLDEKEKEIQMRTEEIQGLKKRVQEKENENQSLKDQISKQESSRAQVEEEQFRQEEQLEMTHKHLEEKVFELERELAEAEMKSLNLQNQKTSDEKEILEKSREIEKLKEAEIRMKAENEVNQRMIQQLMDKLASSGVSHPSGFRTNSEVSTSSTRIQKCEICWNETNDREAVRCQKCRRPFHQKCSSQWLKSYKNCPSCEEEFVESTNTHFSSFS